MGSTPPLRDYFPALLFIEDKITLQAVPRQRAWQNRDPPDSFSSGLNFTAHLISASRAMHHKTKPKSSEVTFLTSHLLNSSREYIMRPWSLEEQMNYSTGSAHSSDKCFTSTQQKPSPDSYTITYKAYF